ncbi:uncharacterized protein LOC62_05G007702 [Vanrija pseudolonga]|uniref:Uncharacterized protein n=1 Tax=Vanrija pseudolonga TaxID=143232 RepID=A0AAF0YDZ9_9TREE|nr:hypothetical protein LOC62_05G007702 [Vanrija pseudolonga]
MSLEPVFPASHPLGYAYDAAFQAYRGYSGFHKNERIFSISNHIERLKLGEDHEAHADYAAEGAIAYNQVAPIPNPSTEITSYLAAWERRWGQAPEWQYIKLFIDTLAVILKRHLKVLEDGQKMLAAAAPAKSDGYPAFQKLLSSPGGREFHKYKDMQYWIKLSV